MRITLSGAMRARDVSRPTDEQLEAAAEREARSARVGGRAALAAEPGRQRGRRRAQRWARARRLAATTDSPAPAARPVAAPDEPNRPLRCDARSG